MQNLSTLPPKAPAAVMLYDGRCVMCQQSQRAVRRLDWRSKVETLDLHHPTVIERYPQLDKTALMGAIHTITPDGRVLVGFFAMRYLTHFLPLMWPVLPLLYLPGMKWVGPALYGWIARRRYAINTFFGVELCEDGVCKLHY